MSEENKRETGPVVVRKGHVKPPPAGVKIETPVEEHLAAEEPTAPREPDKSDQTEQTKHQSTRPDIARAKSVIQYSAYQAQFLFDTTYQANWGAHPASGLEKKGSFHEVVVPELKKIFSLPYTLHCNEIRHGGASYPVEWPYQKDFYSIYYAGTEANGNMDWNTWVVGLEFVSVKPYIYAITQFFSEP